MKKIKFRQIFFNLETNKFSHFFYWGIDYPYKGINTFLGTSHKAYTVNHNQFAGLNFIKEPSKEFLMALMIMKVKKYILIQLQRICGL